MVLDGLGGTHRGIRQRGATGQSRKSNCGRCRDIPGDHRAPSESSATPSADRPEHDARYATDLHRGFAGLGQLPVRQEFGTCGTDRRNATDSPITAGQKRARRARRTVFGERPRERDNAGYAGTGVPSRHGWRNPRRAGGRDAACQFARAARDHRGASGRIPVLHQRPPRAE